MKKQNCICIYHVMHHAIGFSINADMFLSIKLLNQKTKMCSNNVTVLSKLRVYNNNK